MQYLVTQFTFALAAFAPIILGSRLILNLREAYYQPFIEELERKTVLPVDIPLQVYRRSSNPRNSSMFVAPQTSLYKI